MRWLLIETDSTGTAFYRLAAYPASLQFTSARVIGAARHATEPIY